MIKTILSTLAVVTAFYAMPVQAKTCTLPTHPSCTITCPAGCGAVYNEPNGPCHTFCATHTATEKRATPTSTDFQDLNASEIRVLLKKNK